MAISADKEFEELCAIIHRLRTWFKRNHMETPVSIELAGERDMIRFGMILRETGLLLVEARGSVANPYDPEYAGNILGVEIRGPAASRADLSGNPRIPNRVEFVDMTPLWKSGED